MAVVQARASRRRAGLLGGFNFVLRGARLVYFEQRGLVRFWLPPVLITFGCLVVVARFALQLRKGLVASLWASPVGAGWFDAAGRALHTALEWVVAAGVFVLGALVVALLAGIIAAPFNDALSEAVERSQTALPGPPLRLSLLVGDFVRSLRLALAKFALYGAVMGPLLLTAWTLPLVGPLLHAGFGALLTALFLAIDYVDWPASRRGWPVRQRLGLAAKHFSAMLGFGLGVWLVLLVPLLNLFTMPAAVAGGTLMFLELSGSGPRYAAVVNIGFFERVTRHIGRGKQP